MIGLGRKKRIGFTLIELLVVIGIMSVLMGMMMPAIQRVRESANRASCFNNLKQMGLALHQYHQDRKSFPPGYKYDESNNPSDPPPDIVGPESLERVFDRPPPSAFNLLQGPGWGWASFLLPYVDQDPLYRQIDFNLLVESPSMAGIRTTRQALYICPSDREVGEVTFYMRNGKTVGSAFTNSYAACYGYLGFLGVRPDAGTGVFYRNSRVRIADIADGTSNTVAIGDRGAFFTKTAWAGVMTRSCVITTPGAPVFVSSEQPCQTLVLARIGLKRFNDYYSEPYDFFSPHPGVISFLWADGSVRPISFQADWMVVSSVATRAGLERVTLDF